MNAIKRLIAPIYSAVHTLPRVASMPSYYPECKRKGWLRRYCELVWQRVTANTTNFYYYGYGMDRLDCAPTHDYVLNDEFWQKVISQNYGWPTNHAILLRDKYLFALFMAAHKLPSPKIVAYANCGRFYIGDKELPYDTWVSEIMKHGQDVFVKDATSCCAKGVTHVLDNWPFDEKHFARGKFIVQQAVRNCNQINAIQPKSVNTLRIVTVVSKKTGKVELLSPGGLRVGGGADVDNWAAGGLFVGIDEDGTLQKHGFLKPDYTPPLRRDRQPQTGFAFERTAVPFYREAVELVKRAHSFMPEIVTIGWDVALTPDGPVLIEGNDDWELTLMQMVAGGLRKRFEELGVLK